MARIDIKGTAGGGGGSGTVTSVAVSSTTLTVTGSPITSSGTITANIPDGYLKVGTGVTGSLQNVVDTNGTATQLFLSSTGIQATSKIQITTADTNYIDAEDNSGNNRFTVGRDPSSQLVTVDFASVPTALTTPVGAIRTATDGITLANVMTFLENGNIGLGTDSPGSKFDVHSSGAIVAQFNKTVSGNSYIQQLMAGTARWKYGFTTATGAFDIIDDVNALTRLSLLNTGQLKLNAYTSTSAFTGTTAGFLAFDASGNILSVTSPATSPSGVSGAIQFSNGSAFASDATNFFWDDTNNRLGIGTNAPTAIIQSQNATNGVLLARFKDAVAAASYIDIKNDATLNEYTGLFWGTEYRILSKAGNPMFVSCSNNINFADGFSTKMTVTPSEVQIGTISGARLGIKGSGSTSATTSLLVQNSASTQLMSIIDDGRMTIGTSGGNSGALLFQFPQVGTNGVFWGDTWSNIYGSITLSRGTGEMRFEASSGGYFQTFLAGGAERMRITQNGNIGMGTASPNASSVVDVSSTTQGFLPPRMTTTQKNAIATPAAGLVVYDTTLNKLCVRTAAAWETITSI
jgi:hypothetical protein